MKRSGWVLGAILVGGCCGLGRSAQQSNSPAPPDQQTERPTLRPRNAPPGEISAPDNSTTSDPPRLLQIQTVYIENIDNYLSEKLVESLDKLGRFRLVTNPKHADALIRGTCLESRRLKHVHSEVYISDRNGAAIWQDSIYRPFNPPSLDQAVTETAELVEVHLGQALRGAERH